MDGIILMYSRMNDHILTYLRARDFPFVIIGKPYDFLEEITYVDNDNVLAAEQATDYLIQLGHERIGFIGGDVTLVMTHDRLLGYERALKRAGIDRRREYTLHEDFCMKVDKQLQKDCLPLMNRQLLWWSVMILWHLASCIHFARWVFALQKKCPSSASITLFSLNYHCLP